jgi:hypothetical protein
LAADISIATSARSTFGFCSASPAYCSALIADTGPTVDTLRARPEKIGRVTERSERPLVAAAMPRVYDK